MNFTPQRSLAMGRPAVFLLLLLLSAAAPAGAKTMKEGKLPGTSLGKIASAYLQTFNRGSRDALRDFIAANYSEPALQESSVEARATAQWDLYRSTGGLAAYEAEEPSEGELLVWTRARLTGEWLRLRFTAEAGKPRRIPGIAFEPVTCPAWADCPRRLNDAQVVAELKSYMDTLAAADAFAGVVLLARDGTPLYEKAYGAGPWQAPNLVSTRFALASMGKMFTGVAVAQLAEQGRVSFQDPIRKYLPEQPRKITSKVTLHHLLTHTSGMASFLDLQSLAEIRSLSLQDSLAVFFRKGLSFEPGEQWQYSNAGFMTLEAIVERVSRQTFPAYLEEHIFKPAGMKETLGGFTTAEDLLRFATALRENKLLNREYTEKVVSGRAQTAQQSAHYAYGFVDQEVSGQRIVGHAGAASGWNGQLDIYWESGYTVVVLANRDAPVAQRVAVRLRDLLNRR
jgi:CubicO group peptidase (beta-lactamase class C family)